MINTKDWGGEKGNPTIPLQKKSTPNLIDLIDLSLQNVFFKSYIMCSPIKLKSILHITTPITIYNTWSYKSLPIMYSNFLMK